MKRRRMKREEGEGKKERQGQTKQSNWRFMHFMLDSQK
jgi:hypothetical protein